MCSLWIVFLCVGVNYCMDLIVYVKIFFVKYEKWLINISVGGLIRWYFKLGMLYIRGFIVINIKFNLEIRYFLLYMSCRVNCFKILFFICGCNVFICIFIMFYLCFVSNVLINIVCY